MYSTTQASNLATIVGIIMFALNYFKINIGSEEVTAFLGAILSVGGIAYNWYKRYSQGDLKVSGFRKM